MSGITMDVRLYTMMRHEAWDSLDHVVFLKHVLPHVSDKLLVVWDGSPNAPDLNPDAGIWNQLKHGEMRHLCCRNLAHLRSELGLAIRRGCRKPHLLTACFAVQDYPSKMKFCMQRSVVTQIQGGKCKNRSWLSDAPVPPQGRKAISSFPTKILSNSIWNRK
jgi:hypothetical protein